MGAEENYDIFIDDYLKSWPGFIEHKMRMCFDEGDNKEPPVKLKWYKRGTAIAPMPPAVDGDKEIAAMVAEMAFYTGERLIQTHGVETASIAYKVAKAYGHREFYS